MGDNSNALNTGKIKDLINNIADYLSGVSGSYKILCAVYIEEAMRKNLKGKTIDAMRSEPREIRSGFFMQSFRDVLVRLDLDVDAHSFVLLAIYADWRGKYHM